MSALQRRIIEFLDAELDHSLGSYRVARDRLARLASSIEQDRLNTGKENGEFLAKLTANMRRFNHDLNEIAGGLGVKAAGVRTRQATPDWVPFSRDLVNNEVVTDAGSMSWIAAYYGATQCGLRVAPERLDEFVLLKAILLSRGALPRDDGRRDTSVEPQLPSDLVRRERADRHKYRLHEAKKAGVEFHRADAADSGAIPESDDGSIPDEHAAVLQEVAKSHMGSDRDNALARFVLHALSDGHLLLHVVDVQRSRPIGRRLSHDALSSQDDARSAKALARSIVLNTFVWTVCRTAPWIFAESKGERNQMTGQYWRSWAHCRPMRTMWIATQLSLLAIYRRSHAHMLAGDLDAAYQDLHKLQASIREASRRLRLASMQVDGANAFLETLDALADFRVGMLYRQSGDQRTTLKYLRRSYEKLERLKAGEGSSEAVVNSRWVIELQLALGKSCYELGKHKAAIRWYLTSWRSLLELLGDAVGGRLTIDPLDAAIEWLNLVVDEPELHKVDLLEVLGPAVAQIEAFRVDERFRAIAGEILLHLGHILFVLNLDTVEERPEIDRAPSDTPAEIGGGDKARRTAPVGGVQSVAKSVAWRLLRRAWKLDRANTLAASNLLRAGLRGHARDNGELPERLVAVIDGNADGSDSPSTEATTAGSTAMVPIKAKKQWSGGRSEADGLSRLFDAQLLRMLWRAARGKNINESTTDADATIDRDVARDLLRDFLIHTDSIESRKSQVYSNLVKPRLAAAATTSGEAALEFICLRRYSSAYPILPRPREFRSDGGGYFVRVHPGGGGGTALGIAVDPGTGYIDCLYRERLSVADIDVILVTHDHVDHASALEPLLAIRHEARKFSKKGVIRPIWILGNESIFRRLSAISMYTGSNDIKLVNLADTDQTRLEEVASALTDALANLVPSGVDSPAAVLTLDALPSSEIDGTGHVDAMKNASTGLLITLGVEGGPSRSIAVGGDLPNVPADAAWTPAWERAFQSDLLVAHLSTVPMTELRKLSGLGELHLTPALAKEAARLEQIWHGLGDDMEARFKYALWLEYKVREDVFEAVGPLDCDEALEPWRLPEGHPYLQGTMRLARAFRDSVASDADQRPEHARRQFLIGELSEELGSVRNKIALRITKRIFNRPDPRAPAEYADCRAITADIGMRSILSTDPESEEVRVQCSTCALDFDMTTDERLHPLSDITEVCVKGENEGIFYSCAAHRPDGQVVDPTFVERHERFDVFGR
jgi:tetratricopeptide (TPR) repeat protein